MALESIRGAINAFLEDAAKPNGEGVEADRKFHAGRLQKAWKNLVDSAFDKDAASLIPKDQQRLIQQEKQTLVEQTAAINAALNSPS